MYEYHGWFSTYESANENLVQISLKEINGNYPVNVNMVNGKLHISFSGNPNRDLGQLAAIVEYLCGLKLKLSGCVYINDANSDRYNAFDVIKIVEDTVSKAEDRNFTNEETSFIFE